MSLSKTRSKEETEEIYELAQFISDYNTRKRSIDERFPPMRARSRWRSMTKGIAKPRPAGSEGAQGGAGSRPLFPRRPGSEKPGSHIGEKQDGGKTK